jgi:hypothetical protein
MAGIEEAFEKFVTRVSSRERSPAEEPLSNYKSYSENELLSNLDAKMPNLEIVDNELVNMPMYKPMDVLPPRSRPVMPSKEYLERRLFLDLAKGGRVIKRKRYADGGNAALNTVNGIPLDEFLKINYQYEKVPVTDKYGNPTFDNFGRQNFTATVKQEYIGDNPLFDWNTGQSTKIGSTGMSTPTTTEFPTIDPFTGKPYDIDPNAPVQPVGPAPPDNYYNEIPTVDPFSGQQVSAQDQSSFANVGGISPEDFLKENPGYVVTNLTDIAGVPRFNAYKPEVPTVDPFSGQQVSAQDQAAFTQPQPEIFPTSNNIANTLNVGSSDPLTNILGSQVGNLSYSEMNALRNRSPNVLSSNVGANLLQALGTGLKDFAYVGDKLGPDYYKNLSGNFFENIKNLDKGFSYDPTYMGADKTGRLDYYKQGIKSLLGMNTPGSNVGGGTPGMRYAIEQISPYLSKTVGPALNILGSAPVTAFGILDALTGPANAPEVGRGPEYFRQQLQLPENSPVSRFNQVQDPRSMMAYGGRVSMSNGGLTKTVPPVRGPSPQGVESLFRRRYN